MTQPSRTLHAVPDYDDSVVVTRQQRELAAIEQQHREWSGPCGKGEIEGGWQPIEVGAANLLDADEVLQRSAKVVVVDQPIPLWRRLLRWITRQ